MFVIIVPYKCVAAEDPVANSVGYPHVLIIITWDFIGAIKPFNDILGRKSHQFSLY